MFGISFLLLNLELTAQQSGGVKIWEEDLTLPTYRMDPPEKSPMFFDHDSYQGASRMIYPYPLEDDFTGEKIDKTYRAVYIENEFLKVCILPEIGGRLFYATDKTNGYEIFYRQHVIKPAHIGMLGAWISGGIEFCVFHHHRATTNMPVDYKLTQNEDGSATLWIGETEWRHRMKWTFGITLFPGKSYLELDGRLINSTENTNSILYWANVATSVNEDYQVIFPPSTEFTVFHSKNSFAHWPITQEAYRGNDYYKDGIDASFWKNHPGPNSFFAHEIKEGFLAGYDHGKEAGTMLVGNPHIVKGAKLWEWGKGSIWDTKVLTDNDGPYAEVMSGAYSDNQPDYSWLKPYELKKFKQYWYPMRSSQGAVAANLNGLLNVKSESSERLFIAANTTASYSDARIVLQRGDQTLFEKRMDIAPNLPFQASLDIENDEDMEHISLALYNSEGDLLIEYQNLPKKSDNPLPPTVKPPLPPKEISSIEELYFTGLRIKQFYNARTNPLDYFQEALNRDSLDSRCNTQVGIYYKERGAFNKATKHFRQALIRPTFNYTRPRDCEAFYHLGVVLKGEGLLEEAYDTLYRAAWDHAYTAPAYYHLAQISCHRKDYDQALLELDRSLMNNASNLNALNLKAAVLRKLGQNEQAQLIIQDVIEKDKLNFWAYHEQALLLNKDSNWEQLRSLMRDQPESYMELALYYINSGLIEEADQILTKASLSPNQHLSDYPTMYYYLGYLEHIKGNDKGAKEQFAKAKSQSTDYCFPFRLESIKVYQTALSYDPEDAKAHYYLGNLWFDKQPDLAIQHWEQAVQIEPNFAIAHRNLGWGYYRHSEDPDQAIAAYEKALLSDNQQPRYYEELDELYELNGTDLAIRYETLSKNHDVVKLHSGSLLREAMVAVASSKFDHAIDILTNNFFNRREGRNDLHDLYVDAFLLRGQSYLRDGKWEMAAHDFQSAILIPDNLVIGKNENSERRAQAFYLTGKAMLAMKKKKAALDWFRKASEVRVETPAYHFQRAMAYKALGQTDKAEALINLLQDKGEEVLNTQKNTDFFSIFGENQKENERKAKGNFLLGLANLGLENTDEAIQYFEKAIELNPGHAWAKAMLAEIQ